MCVTEQFVAMPPAVAEEGRITGIIYPPPEVRNIVDKTASFVARNGPEFEQRIKQNEVNNPKFNFLNSGGSWTHLKRQLLKKEIYSFFAQIFCKERFG